MPAGAFFVRAKTLKMVTTHDIHEQTVLPCLQGLFFFSQNVKNGNKSNGNAFVAN